MLAEQLRQARERAELSMYALAHASGVGVATISEIESGKNENPGLLTVGKLADSLHVSLDVLAERVYIQQSDPGAAALALWRAWLASLGPDAPYLDREQDVNRACYFCGAWGAPCPPEPHAATCIYVRAKALVEGTERREG